MCLQFEERFPPEVIVFDEKYATLEDQLPAPLRASIVLCDVDRSSEDFWKSAFEAFAQFGEMERAGLCLDEVTKRDRGYAGQKLI